MRRAGSALNISAPLMAVLFLSGTSAAVPLCPIHENAKLTASDAALDDLFGVSVSVSGEVAVVGAYGDDCAAGLDCGSAYVYRFNPGAPGHWVEETKLTASDAVERDYIGYSVSVSGDVVVVGAFGDDCAGGPADSN